MTPKLLDNEMKEWASRAAVAARLAWFVPASAHAQFYMDTASPANPPWSTIFSTLN